MKARENKKKRERICHLATITGNSKLDKKTPVPVAETTGGSGNESGRLREVKETARLCLSLPPQES